MRITRPGIIDSNFSKRRVKSRKQDFNFNFRRQRRVFTSQYKQPAHSDVGATPDFTMLLAFFPSEKRRNSELESAERPPRIQTNHGFFPVTKVMIHHREFSRGAASGQSSTRTRPILLRNILYATYSTLQLNTTSWAVRLYVYCTKRRNFLLHSRRLRCSELPNSSEHLIVRFEDDNNWGRSPSLWPA